MHLYVLVAAPFVAPTGPCHECRRSPGQRKKFVDSSAFLVGWALGGSFFGRIGDVLGRSRALSLTILTYALFTGLSSIAQTWWQLLIFRFLAALGIGGEWACRIVVAVGDLAQEMASVDCCGAPDRRQHLACCWLA
jgi:MFS family permease